MTYQSTIDYLFNQLPVFQVIGPGAYKPGLTTAYTLSGAFGNPHTSFKSIHVGGTNGKGSTSHSIAAVLMSAGYKVGLFTSPHLFDFRERIRVNGEKISEEAVIDFVERYRNMNLGIEPSFFELTTIMAFDYFRQCGVDYAVIEVGLGGRLDTTNIITPILSVITNISLDHISLLGNNEEDIAFEKAGIIKPGIPVVIGEAKDRVRKVFEQRAMENQSPIIFAEDTPFDYTQDSQDRYTFSFHNGNGQSAQIECDLIGEFQAKNINTVLHALSLIKDIDTEPIIKGLRDVQGLTHLMGRWMHINNSSPEVVCDTGHNIGAWRYLAPRLEKIGNSRKLRIVLGFVSDKDVSSIFAILPENAEYYFVTPSVKRGRKSSQLLSLAKDRNLSATAFDDVLSGYTRALEDSAEDDLVFVGGSNFVVSELPINYNSL